MKNCVCHQLNMRNNQGFFFSVWIYFKVIYLWWWKGLSKTTIEEPEFRQGLFFDTRYLYNRTVKLTKASLSLNYSTESESLINCTDWNFLTRQFNAFIEKIWIDQFVYFWSFAISDWDFNLLILIVNISPRQFPVFILIYDLK